ncbi:MAG: lysine--tRNA ligase [Parcubacteria group bacterium]|nr:lysine--tRNA ligase [Parcubacteria group bacterium]
MVSIEELRNERIKKLQALSEKGINSYPVLSRRDVTIEEAHEQFQKLSKRKKLLFLVGRITALRGQGKIIFFNFTDGTGVFQGLCKKDEMEPEQFSNFVDFVDIGDFVEVSGSFFKTKKGEQTLSVSSWKMIGKALRPLPEKWHGLQDVEEKFRKRYLDILSSEESRGRFVLRSKMIQEIRRFLDEDDFLEVETPTLQPLYGGASAEPFTTHHNALDVDLYLRISNELYLKRLLVGNVPRVYEIYKAFRNEGIDVTHYPEFTMIEFYESYGTAESQMKRTEKMLKEIVKKLLGKATFPYNKNTLDFGKPFKRVTYYSILKQYALLLNPESSKREELALKAQQLGVPITKSDSREKIMDNIYKKACRPKIIQPTFIVDYPAHMLPLAKKKEGDAELVDAFQLVAGGIEFVKGFSELNDPLDQRTRLLAQEEKRIQGEKDAQQVDEDFLEALEYGMPPAGGVGIGLDRLTMLLTDTHNIKDIILFPTMRQKE